MNRYPPRSVNISWSTSKATMCVLMSSLTRDNLDLGAAPFSIILVSCPVYIGIPTIHSDLSTHPLRIIFSLFKTVLDWSHEISPLNLYNFALGRSHITFIFIWFISLPFEIKLLIWLDIYSLQDCLAFRFVSPSNILVST